MEQLGPGPEWTPVSRAEGLLPAPIREGAFATGGHTARGSELDDQASAHRRPRACGEPRPPAPAGTDPPRAGSTRPLPPGAAAGRACPGARRTRERRRSPGRRHAPQPPASASLVQARCGPAPGSQWGRTSSSKGAPSSAASTVASAPPGANSRMRSATSAPRATTSSAPSRRTNSVSPGDASASTRWPRLSPAARRIRRPLRLHPSRPACCPAQAAVRRGRAVWSARSWAAWRSRRGRSRPARARPTRRAGRPVPRIRRPRAGSGSPSPSRGRRRRGRSPCQGRARRPCRRCPVRG